MTKSWPQEISTINSITLEHHTHTHLFLLLMRLDGPLLLIAATMHRPVSCLHQPVAGINLSALPMSSALLRPRSAKILAQDGWIAGVEASGMTYYYNEQTGASQWDPPQSGGEVLWRVTPFSGTRCYVERGVQPRCYELRNGDRQVLSRFSMLTQKLTVSRVQAIMHVQDGTATLSSCGRAPTLWRGRGLPWVALANGDQAPLTNGDQVSLDCNDPEAAVLTCEQVGAVQQDAYAQPQLPYPWEQLADQDGNIYYSNPQTGEATWEPPQAQQGSGW